MPTLGFNIFALFSKYRTELMGIAIIEVILGHAMSLQDVTYTAFMKILSVATRFVFTEGFLFLSGLGLYFSFSQNPSIKSFYKKRFLRLYFPYVILSSWYFIYVDIIKGEDFSIFMGHISTLAFWYEGNFIGMWYIALSLVLYLFYPFMHVFLYSSGVSNLRFVILLVLSVLLNLMVAVVFPDYYEKISIGISKIPCFIVGSLCGYFALNGSFNRRNMFVTYLVLGLVYVLTYGICKGNMFLSQYSSILEKFLGMSVCTVILQALVRFHFSSYFLHIFRWFGKYTLELYVLHLLIFSFLGLQFKEGVSMSTKIVIMCTLPCFLCKPIHYVIDRLTRSLV